jgi:NOL1/NOP2/sun family putative RNA methylase
MTSRSEALHRLPGGFVAILQELFTPLTVDHLIAAMMKARPVTLRVNTLAADAGRVRERLRAERIRFETVPWYGDAFVLPDSTERDVEKLDLYAGGKVYLQSLSSMLPVLVLRPARGERILDLTAAPGSKTTQIAAFTANTAEIVACELDRIRFERLKYNIAAQGARGVIPLNLPAEKLTGRHPEYSGYFDKVLLDAPCSGEGRFLLSSPQTFRHWSEKTVRDCASLQKKLVRCAAEALKPGGILVYSTCTVNREENEAVVDHAVKNLGLAVLETGLKLQGSQPGLAGGFDPSTAKALRIPPGRLMEGFFVCRMKKPD